MNRTRKSALGIGAAAVLVAGGIAVAAPALAQDGTPPAPPVECPYECPYDGDGLMQRHQPGPHSRDGQQRAAGEQDQLRQRDRDGTCQRSDNEGSEG